MVSPDFYLCDLCGARVEEKLRIYVATDRRMDAAGSMDDVGEQLDLCPRHLWEAVGFFLADYVPGGQTTRPHYEHGRELVAWVRKRQAQLKKKE